MYVLYSIQCVQCALLLGPVMYTIRVPSRTSAHPSAHSSALTYTHTYVRYPLIREAVPLNRRGHMCPVLLIDTQ